MGKLKELVTDEEIDVWLLALPQHKCPICSQPSPFTSGHADCIYLEELIGYHDEYKPLKD